MTERILLGPDDPLPARPSRILAHGASGSGKTTLCRAVADRLGLPHTELDGLHHGPGWVPRPTFLDEVGALVAGRRWVTEYQYPAARPLLLARADLLVWLDLPRSTVLRQVTGRTLRRWWTGEVLWNGNIEQPPWRILLDRDHIIRWAWRTHPLVTPRAAEALRREPPPVVVRLRSRSEIARWLDGPLTDIAR